MTVKNNREPAFPGAVNTEAPQGMSLRDWFAGQALSGITANPEEAKSMVSLTFDQTVYAMSKAAYGIADAMLEERNK